METLIFFLVISTTNLVFCDDKAAIEPGVGYKVHAPPEGNAAESDQQAESSHVVGHSYGQLVQDAGLKDLHDVRHPHKTSEILKYSDEGHLSRKGDARYTIEVQNVHEQPVQYLHENIRQNPIVVNEGDVHSVPSQIYSYQEQQIGVQQYPVHHDQTHSASPLRQVYNEHATGYQTYVEHVSEAEDEEIKSAVENSLGDIKRLVPKSGVSFKIYHKEKVSNSKPVEHKIETEPHVNLGANAHGSSGEFQNSVLHHRERVQAPVQQLQIQTSQIHQQSDLNKSQKIYVQQNIGEHHTFGNQLPVGDALYEGQNQGGQFYYAQQEVSTPKAVTYTQPEISSPRPIVYIQPEVSSPKPILEITGKAIIDPPYRVKLRDDYVKATSKIEFNKNTGHKQDSNHLKRQQSKKNILKTIKQNLQYQTELTEGVQKVPVAQGEGLGTFLPHEGADLYAGSSKGSGNFIAHPVAPQVEFSHGINFPDTKTDQPILNRLSGSFINEGIKPGPVINHLGAYPESQYKTILSTVGNIHADNEALKTVNYETKFDLKSSPNTFDHQKALEGSTSFDIKNAIGNTEGVEAQTGYVSTTEIHPTQQLQKQQLVYNLPSLPTGLIENSVLKTPIEGHQIKTFTQVTSIPHPAPIAYYPHDIGGKLYRQPQFAWTSEHFKQGNELHQPVIKLHLPKAEIQYVKTQKLEVPSIVTHQHQPLLIQQNVPYKPQMLHFQLKKAPQGYQTNLKLPQPLIIDWSLFKSKFPNVNVDLLAAKPELVSYIQDPTKKIMPILVRKRKNRSNNKEVGVVYGKAASRGPSKPNQREEKKVRANLIPSASNDVNQYETKGGRKNEFAVSASYKVDRSYKSGS